MYRDDLEAALARNATLERRIAELERGARPATTTHIPPAPAPRPPRRVTSQITYAPPATWTPLYVHFTHSLRHTWRSLVAKVPRWEVPRWSSVILVLDLLARPAAWLAAVFAVLAMMIWFALGVLWLVPALVISAVGFALGSIALLPIIAIASIRRGEALGLRWGTVRPKDDDPDHLLLLSIMSLGFVQLPVTMMLL